MQKSALGFLYFGLSIIGLFLLGCNASKTSNSISDDNLFEGQANRTLCKKAEYANANLKTNQLKVFFSNKFENSRNFGNFNIITEDNTNFYLVATGKREGAATRFGIELAVVNDKIILEDFDKFYFTCIARYCNACDFKFNADGTIGGCNCTANSDEQPPKGYSPCEHTIAVKTSEKE